MNLCLLFEADYVAQGRVVLRDRRHRHIRAVIRPKVGDTVTVGLLDGDMGEARVLELGPDSVTLDVALDSAPPAPLDLTLLIALPRPKSAFRILQLAATMGVKDIRFFNTSRVEKSFWQSREFRPESMREHLILGLEQARDTALPKVTFHRLFAPLINDELGALTEAKTCLLAHPTPGAQPCPHRVAGPVVLAIGPERGLIDYEVRRFQESGFEAVGLGPRVLRTEQAVAVALAKLFD
jgi:16S rRNA (uracil1498-N3)-methyltransferase